MHVNFFSTPLELQLRLTCKHLGTRVEYYSIHLHENHALRKSRATTLLLRGEKVELAAAVESYQADVAIQSALRSVHVE